MSNFGQESSLLSEDNPSLEEWREFPRFEQYDGKEITKMLPFYSVYILWSLTRGLPSSILVIIGLNGLTEPELNQKQSQMEEYHLCVSKSSRLGVYINVYHSSPADAPSEMYLSILANLRPKIEEVKAQSDKNLLSRAVPSSLRAMGHNNFKPSVAGKKNIFSLLVRTDNLNWRDLTGNKEKTCTRSGER